MFSFLVMGKQSWEAYPREILESRFKASLDEEGGCLERVLGQKRHTWRGFSPYQNLGAHPVGSSFESLSSTPRLSLSLEELKEAFLSFCFFKFQFEFS